jgi:ankyrin repeat protein
MRLLKILAISISMSGFVACAGAAEKTAAPVKPSAASSGDAMVEAVTSGQTALVKKLIKEGQSIDALSTYDQTGLMKVAEDGDAATVDRILKLGADLNRQNSNGETALWFAVYGGHEDLALSMIAKGAKADQIKKDVKECLLHSAARAQLPKLAAKLKALTPNCLTLKNEDGQTPSDIVEKFGDKKLAALLAPGKNKSK